MKKKKNYTRREIVVVEVEVAHIAARGLKKKKRRI